ncbi:pre-rRNA-processing protein TSR1-like protein [Leptotrombidium deliense]|uniref:Pre-rRNA-processing protein TSR1 homolog n=1 Tax=Leptotrombidium deliense TaxID=299467 RepID=A0A443SNJ8_9ACAR|nr:pre-rRNA-processing protein TSR1-like protein [Leptotrombidium deliense]
MPERKNLYAVLDAVKVSDVLLLVYPLKLDEDYKIDDNFTLNAIFSHCLPTTLHLVRNLSCLPIKKQSDVKKNLKKAVESKFPDEKILTVDNDQQCLQLFNLMVNCKKKSMSYRKQRAQVLAEKFEFEPNNDTPNKGTLKVTGFVRNRSMNVNGLVHITGWGDFQLSEIEFVDDPYTSNEKSKKSNSMDIDAENKLTLKPDISIQETLDTENIPDEMEGEQTFPSTEEIIASQLETKKVTKRVPKGTSEYQAAWIIDDDENADNVDDDNEDEENEEPMDDKFQPVNENSDDEDESDEESCMDDETETMSVNEGNYDEKLNAEEEEKALQKFKEARMEEMFPDEVDTPIDIDARVRFGRYRGLKSFRSSPIDPKENLPKDYSRIFQFQNFQRTKRRIFNEEADAVAENGSFVCMHLKDVPQELVNYFENNRSHPLIVHGLLPFEQKMSVINIVLRKHHLFPEPVKSKETLIFHVGCRRFTASPIYSCHTNGDKHKYERFLRNDTAVVATIYAPITFPPASVVVFKEYSDGTQSLVATGSLLSADPDRIIMKRIRLSGHPFKINKKSAVVRYMFFNREDILWFKPIELRTKYGRKGHIKEPLGTHGHMKCTFDRQLKSEDTVIMNLYKRVYPKWNYENALKPYTNCSESDEMAE